MRFNLRASLLILMLCVACSCSKSSSTQPAEGELTRMQFAVVESLLGAPVSLAEPALTVRPPKDWAPLDSVKEAQVLASMQDEGDRAFRLRPLRVLMNPVNNCALVLSSWSSDSLRGWKEIERVRRARLDEHFGAHAKHDTFLLGGQICLQSLIQDSVMVNFKLLLANGAQLDYLVPSKIYASQAELIESSLGSLTFPSTSTSE